jgi:predicted GH43/DUF377 family glycosyl hydrolase
MKKYFTIIPLLLTITFFSCDSTDMTAPPSVSEKGYIYLKIDKENAPQSVVQIIATLSREGYPVLSESLNLLSDSTAEISFQNLAAGIWHLTVEALNDSGIVIFFGETDVNVVAGMITHINLVLQPVSGGVGGIYLFVTWGSMIPPTTSQWTDFINNPLIDYAKTSFDYKGVMQPQIFYDNNQYRMWFTGVVNNGIKFVLSAVSNDGINWRRESNYPVIFPGPYQHWDSWAVHAGPVIKENNVYRMYYSGWDDAMKKWHIGLAFSSDGINWLKHPFPIMYAGEGWEFQIIPSSIIKVNDIYYLYYYGRNYPSYNIGLAFSNDGINWVRYGGNPILTPTRAWEGTGVMHPSVIRDGNNFKMVYGNALGEIAAFGMATSTDGKNWVKLNSNPIFTKNHTASNWAKGDIAYPHYIKVGNEERIYYSGASEDSSNIYKIGVTIKKIN